MIHILFGNYLKNAGKLTAEQLSHIYEEQKKVRVKLGLIAVSEKMMSLEQADEVNKLQSTLDKRFGDIAVERGYLTDEQVGRLLGKQGNLYLSFVQEITNENLMSLEEVEEEFTKFQKELNFTQSDMDLLKSGDADLMIPLFLPLEIDELQKNHILVCVKTLMRLIDNDLYIDKAYAASSIETVNYALQELKGDASAALAFAGDADALLPIACKFGEEDFQKVDLDALDACAELINCINGMFASDSAPKFDIDMLPPVYAEGRTELSAGKIDGLCILPVYVKGNRVNVVSVFRDKIIAKGVN